MKTSNLKVYTDAASRKNPGPAAIAYSIYDFSGNLLDQKGKYIGEHTNNVAEYKAIIAGLEAASKYSSGEVECFSDSALVVNQMNQKNKVRKKHLKELFMEVKQKEKFFQKVKYYHLRREHPMISKMDKLANKTLNQAGK